MRVDWRFVFRKSFAFCAVLVGVPVGSVAAYIWIAGGSTAAGVLALFCVLVVTRALVEMIR